MINEDCNGLLEKAQRGDYSTGMPRQGEVFAQVICSFLRPIVLVFAMNLVAGGQSCHKVM